MHEVEELIADLEFQPGSALYGAHIAASIDVGLDTSMEIMQVASAEIDELAKIHKMIEYLVPELREFEVVWKGRTLEPTVADIASLPARVLIPLINGWVEAIQNGGVPKVNGSISEVGSIPA